MKASSRGRFELDGTDIGKARRSSLKTAPGRRSVMSITPVGVVMTSDNDGRLARDISRLAESIFQARKVFQSL
jgi:hypothetical protein